MQTKLIFRKSLNPTPHQVYASDLQDLFWTVNKDRKLCGLSKISHSDICQIENGMSVYQYLNRPFDRLTYYERFSTYKNNVRYGSKRN